MSDKISINCGAMKASLIPYGEGIGPWSQEMVDAAWKAIGYPYPGPRVPPSLVGRFLIMNKGGRRVSAIGKPKTLSKDKLSKAEGKLQNDFLNFWGKAVTDPCRKQSGISKVAGGILQVASFVMPAAGALMFAAAEAGNAVLDASKLKRDFAQATDILTNAVNMTNVSAPAVVVNPPPVPLVAPTSMLVPQPAPVIRGAPPIVRGVRWVPRDYAVAGVLAVSVYLLLRRLQR